MGRELLTPGMRSNPKLDTIGEKASTSKKIRGMAEYIGNLTSHMFWGYSKPPPKPQLLLTLFSTTYFSAKFLPQVF
jgi:hypothetical protein